MTAWRLMRMGLLTLLLATSGCAEPLSANPPEPSTEALWTEQVYPRLLRDCGFPECHGNPGRFFRVFGPGRTRMSEAGVDGAGNPIDVELYPQTGDIEPSEVMATYERARSMLASSRRPEDSLLVRKPLAVEAGGAPHRGIDSNGRDVYQTTGDDGYMLLLTWARTGYRAP